MFQSISCFKLIFVYSVRKGLAFLFYFFQIDTQLFEYHLFKRSSHLDYLGTFLENKFIYVWLISDFFISLIRVVILTLLSQCLSYYSSVTVLVTIALYMKSCSVQFSDLFVLKTVLVTLSLQIDIYVFELACKFVQNCLLRFWLRLYSIYGLVLRDLLS